MRNRKYLGKKYLEKRCLSLKKKFLNGAYLDENYLVGENFGKVDFDRVNFDKVNLDRIYFHKKYWRQMVAVITAFVCVIGITGCQSTPVNADVRTSTSSGEVNSVSSGGIEEIDSWKTENYQEIVLDGDRVSTNAKGVTVDGTTITITAAGTYVLSGVLQNGRIIVNASKKDKVTLVWNGAEIFCEDAAPVFIVQADKTIFYLADGTTNQISDGENYLFADGETEPDATVFAKDDLIIEGTGSLTVNANYYDGIVCKNDLEINGGILTVNAANQGIKGKDSLTVRGGIISICASDDGMKSSNEALVEEDGKEVGWVRIEGGTITIAAGDDAIHAESDLTIDGGKITITESYEGLEGACIYINGGEISLYASDDGINAAGYAVTDALSDRVEMERPNEGNDLENSLENRIGKNGEKGGNRNMPPDENRVTPIEENPEWIDMEGKEPEAGIMERPSFANEWENHGGRGGMEAMESASSGGYLELNGGTIYVNANGDGIDVNGSMVMNGGVVQIDGTESGGDGALDYDGTFEINGGVLIGVGNGAMAQTAGSGSTQYSMAVYFDTIHEAGSVITVQDASGMEILSYTPQKQYNFFTFSSEALEKESTYTVLVDKTEEQSFTLTEVVTTSGKVSGAGGFGGRNHGGMSFDREMVPEEGMIPEKREMQ